MSTNLQNLICISSEIASAKRHRKPIVALESTIITHGMPFPANYQTAIAAEQRVRKSGSVPATIAVFQGKIKIGLSTSEIKTLARSKSTQKLSIANLSMSLAQNVTGSTTVASTLLISALADIQVFATGGIGGVHRGANTTFDISTDLKQLASSPVNVICAGPKAILDLPKTVELLESLGVPLITYKRRNMPAFWSQDSGLKSPIVAETVKEIVQSFLIRSRLGLTGAQLVCNPIPEKYEISIKLIEPLINKSIAKAKKNNVNGKALTPFLLSEILRETKGKSLEANKALLFNNIDLASKIAKTLANINRNSEVLSLIR